MANQKLRKLSHSILKTLCRRQSPTYFDGLFLL